MSDYYHHGYLQALLDTAWKCVDCGNTYQPDVEGCPNEMIDDAKARVRKVEHEKHTS